MTESHTPAPSTSPDPTSRTHDALAAGIGAAALGLLVGAPWLVDTSGPEPFYKGPLIFPLIALALVIVGAAHPAFRLARDSGRRWFVDGRGVPWTGIGVFVLMCFFPTAIRLIGLGPAALVFVFAGLLAAGYRRLFMALAVAAATALILHLAFIAFLDIWFPEPAIMSWFGN
jgi:Tripartite tricarboxylate transporter TctB family